MSDRGQFERREDLEAMVQLLTEAFDELDRGDVLSRERVQAIVECEPNTKHWALVLNKARKQLLLDRGIATHCDREVGVRLLSRQEQLTWLPDWRARRARRQIRRAVQAVKLLPEAGLTMHQRRQRLAVMGSLSQASRDIATKIKANQAAARPAPARPAVAIRQPEVQPQPWTQGQTR